MSTHPEDQQPETGEQQPDTAEQQPNSADQQPEGAQGGAEQPEQDAPLTAEDILGAEQTEAARQGDQDEAPAQSSDALAQERLEDLRRLQAEFVNYKNRTTREREQLRDHVVGDLIASLIPVLDDIDAGRRAGEITEGPFASIAAKLEDTLGKSGLERIGQQGEPFDPAIHEAVLQQPAEGVEEDHVSIVLRSGFRVGGRVVRPAQVAVAPAS